MKFAVYVLPSTDMHIRCIDGEFCMIDPNSIPFCEKYAEKWAAILSASGTPVSPDVIIPLLQNGGYLLAHSRAMAKMFYGLPDDVELYAYGDFGIQTDFALVTAREAAGLTQKQLAEASGVNIRQIQRIENGEAKPENITLKNALAIADVLHIDPRKLIGNIHTENLMD